MRESPNPRETDTWAVISAVSAATGWFLMPCVIVPLGLIPGIVSLVRINQNTRLRGLPLCVFGIVGSIVWALLALPSATALGNLGLFTPPRKPFRTDVVVELNNYRLEPLATPSRQRLTCNITVTSRSSDELFASARAFDVVGDNKQVYPGFAGQSSIASSANPAPPPSWIYAPLPNGSEVTGDVQFLVDTGVTPVEVWMHTRPPTGWPNGEEQAGQPVTDP